MSFLPDESMSAASIVPYEAPDKRVVIRPVYDLQDLDELDFLDEVKLGWVRGLKKVATIEGITIYWSPEIAKKVMDKVTTTRRVKPCKKKVIDMFKKAKIVPGFTSRTMFGLVIKKIGSAIFSTATVFGFFHSGIMKVFLILENVSNFLFETDDFLVSQLLIHELLHYAACDQHSKFYSVFRKTLFNWYSYYFSTLFDCNKRDPKFVRLTMDILKLLSGTDKDKLIRDVWKSYTKLVEKFSSLSRLEDPEFKRRYNLHFKLLYSYYTDNLSGIEEVYRERTVALCMFNAYKFGIGLGRFPRTLAAQELIFPSEIICCASEIRTTPQMYHVINSIRV